MKRPKSLRLLGALAVLVLLAAACGDDAATTTTTAGQTGTTTATTGGGPLETGPGFDGTTIKLGVMTALSGPVATPIGIPIHNATKMYWQSVNDKGGIAGKYKVEIVEEDHAYDTTGAIPNQKYEKIKDQILLFGNLLGTPMVNALLPKMKEDTIVAAPGSLDAEWIKEDHLIPIGGPYQIQMINGAAYLIEKEGFAGKNMCWFGHEGPYGNAGLAGLEFAGTELGFEVKAKPRINPAEQNPDYTAAVTQLQNASCDAVFITVTPSNMSPLLTAMAQASFSPRIVGQSPVWVSALAASPAIQQNLLLASDGVQWGDTTSPGMTRMLADIAKYAPDQAPDAYFAFGYSQGISVQAVLEKAAANGDLTREGVKKALAETGPVDFGGLIGDYTYAPPAERKPPRATTLFKVNPAVPGALEKIDRIESDAAKKYTFAV